MGTDSGHMGTKGERTGVLARIGGRLRQVVCGLHGHDELLHFEQGRMSLQCVSCGHDSPGWEVTRAGGTGERREASAAPAPRARVVRMPIGDRRRVA